MDPEDLEATPPDLRGITSFAFGGRHSRDSTINEDAVVARVVRYIAKLHASSPLRALGAGDVVRFRVDLYRGAELAASYGLSDEALDTVEGIQAVLDLLGAAGTVVSGIISEGRPPLAG